MNYIQTKPKHSPEGALFLCNAKQPCRPSRTPACWLIPAKAMLARRHSYLQKIQENVMMIEHSGLNLVENYTLLLLLLILLQC
jgi:hypothetical protein